MEIEDFVEPEIAVTATVAAALFSPRARKVMRKGLVYGMAGVLVAGDALTSFARSVGQGVQHAGEAAVQVTQETDEQASGMEEGKEAGEKTEDTSAPRRKTATRAEAAKGAKKAEKESV